MTFNIDFAAREDMKKIYDSDMDAFGEEGSIRPENLEEWYDINNHQWMVAKDEEDNLLGYMAIYHLRESAYKKLVSGVITEKDFTKEDFEEFKANNNIYCYIAGFVAKGQASRVAISLINKTISYFRFLKENNINVLEICAEGFNPKGIKLCEKLGFKKIRQEKPLANGVIPYFFIFDLRNENFSRVINAIKEIFLESEEYL